MRILIISPSGLQDHGGMGRLIGYLTSHWSSRSESPRYRVIDSRGVGHRIWWPLFFIKAYAVVLGELIRRRVDVAHVHVASRGSTFRKLCLVWLIAKFNVPIVLHLHAPDYDRFWAKLSPRFQRPVYRMFARATEVIVLGHFWKEFMCREIGLASERVRILMNAVPGPSEITGPRHDGRCRIVFLGRLEPSKGVDELLNALSSHSVKDLSWEAVLAGRGDMAKYQAVAREAGIADRVRFPGWVSTDRVREYLAEADVFVLPSHAEGLSMAVLEGMSYGLAVITTPVGATPDAIVHEQSGLLIPVNDPAALAGALERVIGDPELRRRLSIGARQRYLESFEIGQYAQRLEQLLQECVLCTTRPREAEDTMTGRVGS
jgi:glycosyltransferase involved in cell wall biosynthesis